MPCRRAGHGRRGVRRSGDRCRIRRSLLRAPERPGADRSLLALVRVRSGLFARGWAPPHPTLYIRRDIYERFGGFDLSCTIAADVELMIRFFEVRRIRTRHVPEILVHMRMGGASNRSFASVARQNREICMRCASTGLPADGRLCHPQDHVAGAAVHSWPGRNCHERAGPGHRGERLRRSPSGRRGFLRDGVAVRAAMRHVGVPFSRPTGVVAVGHLDGSTDVGGAALQGVSAVVHCAARACTRSATVRPISSALSGRVNRDGTAALAARPRRRAFDA